MWAMHGSYDEVRYQVFVSSTFSDLKDERTKVLQAILECKAFPAGMELFPSANDEQFEFIKREIDSSDYYVVIIAGRYGSLADDGTSYTEKEFDYAVAQRKPILAFLIFDPSELPAKKCEQDAEGRERLEQFRKKAKTSRVVAHYGNPDELKSHILHSLNYQFKINPQRGWVPAGQSKREDLEEIRDLQGRVLSLQNDNALLKTLSNEASSLLGHGEDKVSWTIDVTKLVAQAADAKTQPATKIPFPPGETKLLTTWDELLKRLYFAGSSRLDDEDVMPRLFFLLASKISDTESRTKWIDIAVDNLDKKELPLGCLWKVKRDVHRQLTGLGLIEEIVETRYREARSFTNMDYFISAQSTFVPPRSNQDPIPVQVVVWRLTRRGEQQIALISGFRREESKAARPAQEARA